MLENCCAFTGHRPHKFPWRYDETDSQCIALKAVLTKQIVKLAEAGVTDYYSGGADGTDYEKRKIMRSEFQEISAQNNKPRNHFA